MSERPASAGAAVWRVELIEEQLSLEVTTDVPLLEAMRAAGVRLRHACRNGVCEICAARLLQGEVEQRYPAGRFSGDPAAPPLILLCTTYPRSDLRLSLMRYARLPVQE